MVNLGMEYDPRLFPLNNVGFTLEELYFEMISAWESSWKIKLFGYFTMQSVSTKHLVYSPVSAAMRVSRELLVNSTSYLSCQPRLRLSRMRIRLDLWRGTKRG
jgi:hypothetical protein